MTSTLESSALRNRRYNLTPMSSGSVSSQPIGTCGSVRVRARYCNELIMPADEYTLLRDVSSNLS